ncbi:MAG TPA: universal stress protein [Arenicellales bacterium]|nr:universal stress protein [Arenicellales bacterium]
MISNILIPVDGSEHSRKALELGCDLAVRYGAAVHLIHVTESPLREHTMALGGAAITMKASPDELRQAGSKELEHAEEYARNHGVRDVTTEVEGGNPAQRIVESARETHADMIVMGSRGLSDLAGLLVGSVSHKVTNMAPCTCITVR